MEDLAAILPLGTVPQWALLAVVLVALIKIVPLLRQQGIDAAKHHAEGQERAIDALRKECLTLRAEGRVMLDELRDCEDECNRKLKRLDQDLWGEKRQRVAEQISLINVILQNVDAPELRTMVNTLERVRGHIELQHPEAQQAKGEE